MASFFSENDFTCPVCFEIFKNPVILQCSHSACKACLQKFWETKGRKECPVCRSKSLLDTPPINLALKNLCETFLEKTAEKTDTKQVCSIHNEKLQLFCLVDQEPVCLVCRDSRKHTNHRFCPIDEAATDCKEELEAALKPLQVKIKLFEDCRFKWSQIAQHIKNQSQKAKEQIQKEFEKLYQFLREEEAVRVSAVCEEEELKIKIMFEKIKMLNTEIASLSDTIRFLQEKMRGENILFLQNYRAMLKRTQCTLQHPEEPSGALIDVAQHLSNLKFRVWENMQHTIQYTPVNLDPNTGHPQLILSDDLSSVYFSEKQQKFPDNPERFDNLYPCILGSESFASGKHCWDVEVGSCRGWSVGVMQESAQRKGEIISRSGIWYVWYSGNKHRARCTPQEDIFLSLAQNPKRIRVQLDWDRGQLTFSDPLNNTHLYTFRHRFTSKLRPVLNVGDDVPLKILPVQCSVKVNQFS